MRALQLIVRTVSELKPSKINDYGYHYIVLKNVDEKDNIKYVFNLQKRISTKRDAQIYQNWFNACKPGAVLEVVLQEQHPNNVDQWKQFKLIKKHNEGPAESTKRESEVFTSQSEADILALGLRLDKIEDAARNILKAVSTVREDFKDKL